MEDKNIFKNINTNEANEFLRHTVSEYNENRISKPALISRIKERADNINPFYIQYFNQKIQEGKLGYEIKYKSNLKSILILEDDKKDATVETVKTIIASEGEVGNVDVWGMKKLAYPIQKKAGINAFLIDLI